MEKSNHWLQTAFLLAWGIAGLPSYSILAACHSAGANRYETLFAAALGF